MDIPTVITVICFKGNSTFDIIFLKRFLQKENSSLYFSFSFFLQIFQLWC